MATSTWSPYDTLSVDPNAMGFTCVGFAPSKNRRCHNPIAVANRNSACCLLDQIATTNPLQVETLEGLLRMLAPRVLCKRYHQDQAEGVVQGWLSMVARLDSIPVQPPPIRALPPRSFGSGAPQPGSWGFTSVLPPPVTLQQFITLNQPPREYYTPPPARAPRGRPPPQTVPITTSNPPQRELFTRTPGPIANASGSFPRNIALTRSPPLQTPPSSQTSRAASLQRPTTTTRIPCFDPYETLSVNPDFRNFSCVGYSSREHGRCSQLISSVDRIAACALLDRIASRSLLRGRLELLLERLAPRVLCRRRHQGQAGRMVGEWIGKVEEMLVTRAVEESITEGRGRNTSSRDRRQLLGEEESSEDSYSTSEGYNDSSSEDDDDDDDTPPASLLGQGAAIPPPAPTPPLFTSFPPEVEINTPNARPANITSSLLTPSSTISSASTRTNTSSRTPSNPAFIPLPTPSSTISSASTRASTPSPTPFNPASIPLPTPSSTIYSASTRANTPSPTPSNPASAPLPTPSPSISWILSGAPNPHRHRAIRKPIDGDCSICSEPFESNTPTPGIVWCKGTCGQNFHRECQQSWAERAPTCAFW